MYFWPIKPPVLETYFGPCCFNVFGVRGALGGLLLLNSKKWKCGTLRPGCWPFSSCPGVKSDTKSKQQTHCVRLSMGDVPMRSCSNTHTQGKAARVDLGVELWKLSAPNHKSQIASDFKSRSPNRKNFPKSLSRAGQIALSNRAICDLNLCSNRR